MKYLVVGGVAGGATAAARIRRNDESAAIVLFEKGKYISYANCGLPYYIGGTIPERDALFLQTPESFGTRFNVDVRVENEVILIDAPAKTITVRRQDGSEYVENYDKLLLSPGATPVRPPLPGIDSEGIFTLRDVADTDRIKTYMTSHAIRRAVVVGAGFIGLEMAENLHHAGAEVSIVEMANQVMAPIDFSMATQVHQHLLQKGVRLYLEQSVEKFTKRGKQIDVHFKSGQVLEADMVILSIGVRPAIALAKAAGLTIGEAGGIWVDEYLQTSVTDIYAVGDAIEFPHPLTGKPWLNYLANPANRQGRIVADNMVLGHNTPYEGSIGTSIAKVFDMTVASTGLAAKRLKQFDMPYRSSWTHSGSHAGYYPDALPLSLKVTFDPQTGKLYGAQGVGYDGVDKRIDQIALLIKKGGTVYDLMEVEHAYAPPFSSAKDPIAIAGYVAGNILNATMSAITWREMRDADPQAITILDVRTADEYAMGMIPGAVNIPLDELRERLTELPTDKDIYLYCAVGLRGYLATKILRANGYTRVKNLSGGYKTYSAAVAPVGDASPLIISDADETNIDQQTVKKEIKTIQIDACGLQCPGPVLKLKQSIDAMQIGDRLEMTATDAGFARDAQAWCNSTGNILLSNRETRGKYTVVIEKGGAKECRVASTCDAKDKTLIMFSDDLDKALATFVLANGAAATGGKVTLFFTFWGLNVIKKVKKEKVKKDLFGKMFGMMLPSSSLKLKLSKMNMLGIGSRMMRHIMKQKGIDSLESLRQQAIDQGVEMIACQMSMDVMGVKKEELIDGVTIGGVASYMERADQANVNLFI
ncbi:NADPH-dependent 2,4-dienoyl-CoA reductase/sulfur reductase-like enzyme/peroxiredoxin family protein/rhodanese-related sulfurtransferase/TusA-related sulfurtransferase [Parabacteroides sp. PFB2-12]|uniref:FAD-dependent oxidoreductase n=1 Tax=unclassified Parabacteroides TaxID=2649774 RepID=UPI002474648B|nr:MULTISPECIES: FAD-dependent oxidoreductase [unclassified Parabacteroides]MDH6342481.1 NADPH-dependent 2,4-dienoyl-CoA reductase/sulfur reductase-like enzyme/peroxiredoxin family protein/rhodanese-related sulfurtransferase/TusA-related sulfurtransferase [Parabacteroides sp. PM6-13]MDH6390133.1 NADPH-dependent 2,4-dienoyl-CoA reductase/sulfur reductase-like enzyme/peroxiredoxin family protein/rhodanese-related sulfurtransferase/TusA-related sulfurtransferase [Parabacteroides sp. PFB2-12]